jgi:MFS transporter, FSR family, fosmidomycin resistance protein
VLLGSELLDELVSAVPSAGSPAIQETFSTSYATTAGMLLLVPALVALLLEPIIFLAADRWPRRHFVRGGLAVMALSALASALAPDPITLSVAVSVVAVSSGTAVALSQATLMDLYPEARERMMTRWALMGLLGDLAGPLLLAGLAAVGLGWCRCGRWPRCAPSRSRRRRLGRRMRSRGCSPRWPRPCATGA